MERKNRFLFAILFSIIGILTTIIVILSLSHYIAVVRPAFDPIRVVDGLVEVDVRVLLLLLFPIYFTVFFILTIPVALLMTLFNKISRTATYELGVFSTGEGFSTIKMIRRSVVPALFALSFAEIFLKLIPDWIFNIPVIEHSTAENFLPLYDPLQTILGALISLVASIVIFAPTWILNDSGIVTQVKPNQMTARRCPDTEGIGRWFSNLFGGFAILAYPITMFYRFFYFRYILTPVTFNGQGLLISIFWIIGIPLLVMTFVMPFIILNELGLSRTIPRIHGFAKKLGAKDVKPKSLMLEMLEVQDHLNNQSEDSETDSDSTKLIRK